MTMNCVFMLKDVCAMHSFSQCVIVHKGAIILREGSSFGCSRCDDPGNGKVSPFADSERLICCFHWVRCGPQVGKHL